MLYAQHPFFKTLEAADKYQKKTGLWCNFGMIEEVKEVDLLQKNMFFRSLATAHPFIFDKQVTLEKMMDGRTLLDMENLVEDFSLPFCDTLYLLTNPPTISSPAPLTKEQYDKKEPIPDTPEHKVLFTPHGYLIKEISPEQFIITQVGQIQLHDGRIFPNILVFNIDLEKLRTNYWKKVANDSTEMFYIKETACILELTKCISVKRIGVEKLRSFSVNSRGTGRLGYTSVKADNLIHIADKVDYQYTNPIGINDKIDWEWTGFWRGHWRAFYVYEEGKKLKDYRGWDVVDYTRTGKNREDEYCVPGYTWVTEHTRGNPLLADIKNRVVKHE